MDNINLNQPPQPQIQNTNVNTDVPQPRDPRADLSGVNVLNPSNDRSGILVLQNDIRSSAKGATALTTDLFSSLGSAPQKPSFESYTGQKSSDLYATLGSGERVARYENYIPGTDNNERLAAQQSSTEKWINGATKALAKTGSAVVGGTVGLVYGVGAALNDGSFSSIYDNSFSNTLADWDTKLSHQLSNLYTKQEQEKGLFGQMGTANFWSDKFLGGLSFTAGAIISEGIWAYATGGASLSTMGARLGTKLGAVGKAGRWGVEALGEAGALQGLSKYKSFYKDMMANSLQAGRVSKALPNALGKAGELASSVGVLARSAGYEASVEALQFKREAEENFHNSFLSQNGREPNMEEVQKFQDNLTSSSNAVFGYNMAILMPSNLVSMGHILDIKSPIKTGFSSFIDKKLFGYGVDKTVDAVGKSTFKALEATAGQKIARTAFNYAIKPSLSEGLFEEGLQGVTTKTANKWLEHTYDPKHSNTNLDSMGAFYESLGEQYGTKEGWVENGLGMIIGIVGGATNARGEMRQKADELVYESAVATEFQTGNLQGLLMPNRLQSANRMAGFSEEAKIEAQKGNLSKSALAQKSALLTFINAKMTLGDSVSDIVNEVKLGLDSTTEEQWKEAGISVDEIDNHKAETIQEFEDLAKDWKSNKTYWGYMIGQKLVGEQELDTTIAGETTKGGANTMIEALAWQSTIGESANKHMKDAQSAIASELGTEHANAINLNSNLRVQKRELRQQINIDTRSYKTELARRDALVKRIAKLNAMPKAPEGANKPAGKQAGVLTQALIESEEKLAVLTAQLDGYAEQINKSSAYQKEVGAIDFSSQDLSKDVITGQDLVSLDDNLKKFETVLETLQGTNPQRATYLDDLLKEYSDSEKIFLEHKATQRAILDSDFKIENVNSWIQGKVKTNTPMNENTKEWFTQTLESYKNGKEASMALQAESRLGEAEEVVEVPVDKGEVVSKPAPVVEEEAPTQVEVYKKRIAEALKGRHNYLTYIGDNYDDVANKKPTTAEVEEFKKLREEKKFDDPRYKELEQKLSDWKLLDSAVDQQYVSIGDLILGIEQLEQEAAKEDTVDEITPEHAPDIADDEGVKATENVTRYDILQNTNGSMTVKRRKDGKLTLHHLKLSTLADRMATDDFTLKDKEGNQILFGEETPGTVLTVEGVEFKVGVGNAIEVSEDDFMKLQERLNMYPLNTGTTNWTYSDIYTKVGDDFVKMESDFKDATINSERIYELQEGDKLTITINNDGYNDQLLEEYESAKGDKAKKTTLKKLKENLKLNATTTNGVTDNVSILKALRAEVDEHFIRLREKAFELYMAATDKTNVNLGIEVTVGGIFLGSPRFTINEDGKIQSNPITERGAKEIVATGYIENGNVVTSREVKDINKTFVGKLSKNNKDKKIPIVVVRRGNYNVTYPVSMTKTGSDLSSTFDSIFEMKISNQEKVRRINEAIQNNGIKTAKLAYEDVYNEQKLDSTRKAFEEKTTFVSAEDFADKNYKIGNVVKDASINIDLEDLGNIIADAKLRIKLDDSIKYMTEKELKYESMTSLENEISDLGIELYNDYTKNAQTKYVKANGDIIEDTGYTNALDETPIEAPTSQLDKIKNINTLRKAFEGLTPALTKIIGREKIATVKAALKQYDFIKAQVTPNNTNVKNGKKNSDCK